MSSTVNLIQTQKVWATFEPLLTNKQEVLIDFSLYFGFLNFREKRFLPTLQEIDNRAKNRSIDVFWNVLYDFPRILPRYVSDFFSNFLEKRCLGRIIEKIRPSYSSQKIISMAQNSFVHRSVSVLNDFHALRLSNFCWKRFGN